MDLYSRYKRQIVLPEIGETGQKKISAASVLCIGAGGLGCPALLYLAAAGIGRIGIVDFDHVDETNLQRQVLFTGDQIGHNKAQAAKTRLQALNPTIDIQAYAAKLTAQNAEELFAQYDVIIDGTDNFAAKFLINDAAVKTDKPFVYGSILGFQGQLSVFHHDGGPCYRCLFPEAPKENIPNCAQAGIIGGVAGMIGSAQALEALKIIVDHQGLVPLSGTLWTIDMRTMKNRLLSVPKNPECPICSKEKKEIALNDSSSTYTTVAEITAAQAKIETGAVLLDVREQDEWDAGHIDGAQHFALSALLQGRRIDLPTDCDIILYCKSGQRSKQAAQILQEQGYNTLRNMTGGYQAWRDCA